MLIISDFTVIVEKENNLNIIYSGVNERDGYKRQVFYMRYSQSGENE